MKKICAGCGGPVNAGDKFCTNCGAPLQQDGDINISGDFAAETVEVNADDEIAAAEEAQESAAEEPLIVSQPGGRQRQTFCREQTLLQKYFSFRGRLNRKPYILRSLLICLIYAVLFTAANLLWPPETPGSYTSVVIALTVIEGVSGLSLVVRRLHDLGMNTLWCVTIFIPYVRFVSACCLLLKKGDAGANSYGSDPLA